MVHIKSKPTLNPASEASSAIGVCIGQNNGEFIAPVPHCSINCAALGSEGIAQTAQRSVACEMAVRIIDRLQSIEIQKKQSGRPSSALQPF